jgi:crotonobetainyl-CoA:carnitine CoA-transferase CaiB-like acyl-CoA transferase
MCVNRNKRSPAVDMKAPEGRAILERLAARADVLVQSLRAGAIEQHTAGVPSELGYDQGAIEALADRHVIQL